MECSSKLIINEDKEESVGKDHGSTRGPILTVTIPKGMHTRGRRTKSERPRMGYIDDPKKVLYAWFQSTVPTKELLPMKYFDVEGAYPWTRKMLSWAFESYLDELEFEVRQGVVIKL